jgi:hypothetical protein
VYSDDAPSRHVFAKLKDIQVKGKYGTPKYREYRGGSIPVYREPPGLGLIDKVRGEPRWTAWANVAPRLVSDMLVLVSSQRDFYLAIDERKVGRSRWVDGVGLQTSDPAED